MERAFAGPALLAQRLGRTELDARELVSYDPDALVEIFRGPPAVHRYPGSMAGRVQALAAAVVDQYDGDVTLIWRDVEDGRELFRRLNALPGFGTQKAQIFTALLGKQRGVTPVGWREAAGGYGQRVVPLGRRRRRRRSLGRVREYKQAQKAAAKAGSKAGPRRRADRSARH